MNTFPKSNWKTAFASLTFILSLFTASTFFAQIDANLKGHNVGYVLEKSNQSTFEWTQTGDKTWSCINKETKRSQGNFREDRRGEWGVFLTNTSTNRKFHIDLWQKKVYDRTTATPTYGEILKAGPRPNGSSNSSSNSWTAFNPGISYYFIANSGNQKCLDVAGSATKVGTNVVVYGKHGGKNQKFRFVSQGGGYYAIETALKTKTYLSIHNSGKSDNTNIKLNNPVGQQQHFKVEKNEAGEVRFTSKLGADLFLGMNDKGDNLVIRKGAKGSKTLFKLSTTAVNAVTSSPKANPPSTTKAGFFPSTTTASRQSLAVFSGNKGWTAAKHLRTVADMNGDGYSDLVGFGDHEIYVCYGNRDLLFSSGKTLTGMSNNFTTKTGWTPRDHVRMITDVNGDGKMDIAGFGTRGLSVAFGNGTNSFKAPKLVHPGFGNNQQWTSTKHVRTLADIDGDGLQDVVAFGTAKTFIEFGERDGTFTRRKTSYDDFSYQQGYRVNEHERTVADMNNDGKMDLVAFATAGVYVAYGNGDGTFNKAQKVLSDFGKNQGYRSTLHKRTTGDVNGDGKTDIIAFAGDKTKVALGVGGGNFSKVINATNVFSAANNWTSATDHRMVADMNNDGKDDLVGFNKIGAAILLSKSTATTATFPHNYFPLERLVPNRWMADIKDDISLKDLTIPGTHDSGADYGCPDPVYDQYGECQDWSIAEQLKNGIRYLDIRLKYDDEDLLIHHGPCYQRKNFESVLKDIKAFLTANPSEAIIMRFKDEDDDSDGRDFFNRWEYYTDRYRSIIYNGTTIPKLSAARGKVVLIDFCGKVNGYVQHNTLITPKGSWHNTGDEYDRWLANWEQMIACNGKQSPRQKLHFSAFNQNGLSSDADDIIGSVGGSIVDGVAGLFGADTGVRPKTPRQIAEYMNPKLKIDIGKTKYRRGTFGMVVMDFPPKSLIVQLIQTNNTSDKLK